MEKKIRKAKPKNKALWHFPTLGQTVEASSYKEALKKVKNQNK